MKALLVKNNKMVFGESPISSPESGEVRITIRAAGINRADLLQKKGLYPPPPGASEIIGLECSGEINAIHSNVKGFQNGDRVCALLPGGAYAEFAIVNSEMLIPIPQNLSFEEAAAIPEAFMTAFLNLKMLGKLMQGERALIHAGASGVGSAAIQLAKLWGAEVFATVGNAQKVEFCKKLGVDYAINYHDLSFAEQIRKLTSGNGVNVVLDCIGAAYSLQNLSSLAYRGRWVNIGLLDGHMAEIDFAQLLTKNITLMGSTLRNKSLGEKIALTKNMLELLPHFASGVLRPIIDSIYDWREVESAHTRMANNKNMGKIVLRVG